MEINFEFLKAVIINFHKNLCRYTFFVDEMRVPFIILFVSIKYLLIEANSIRENITKDYEFEGDIILYDEEDFSYQILGDAVGSQSRLWKKEENEVQIPYTVPLDTPVFHRRQIQRAIDEFSLKTCIKFIPRNEEEDYVLIDTINWPNYCHSAMGRLGGGTNCPSWKL